MRLPAAALQIAGFLDGERSFTGPSTVQIDLTDACNQRCQVCWLHAPALAERKQERIERAATLPFSLYIQLLDDLRALGTEEIYLAGGGEPLLHPRFWDALQAALDRGLTASLHSNFSLVDGAGVQRLLDLRLHYLTVSLWAGSEASYRATHPGSAPGDFESITARLADLNRRKHDRPVTKLYHVITADNVRDAAGMLELAERLGCDAVELAIADLVPHATDFFGIDRDEAAELLGVLDRWSSRAPWRKPRLLGLEALRSRLQAIVGERRSDVDLVHRIPCFAGWSYARVMADGRVIPCLKAHRLPSGNLHEQRFASIWDGAKQQAFRRAARATRKDAPFFADIGNAPGVDCGCERGCDNLEANRRMAQRFGGLSGLERRVLKTLPALPKPLAVRLGWEG